MAGLVLSLAWALAAAGAGAFSPDWSLLAGRPAQPTCVDIPVNMSLCHKIGYNKMRLPNLLEHDTMAEVTQQAVSWVPLLNVHCHADTKRFLCSLFSPVCLERLIYPCRSLCLTVRRGCESRMNRWGYPWPDMFSCDRFPEDNDMCIAPESLSEANNDDGCHICNQADTYENILDHFCRAEFAIRSKFRGRRGEAQRLFSRKTKILKGSPEIGRHLRKIGLVLDENEATCCQSRIQLYGSEKPRHEKGGKHKVSSQEKDSKHGTTFISEGSNTNRTKTKKSRDKGRGGPTYLIMGQTKQDGSFVPSFIMPWGRRNTPFDKAVRMFRTIDCSDPKLVSRSVIESEGVSPASSISSSRSSGRRSGKGKTASNIRRP